MKYRKLYAIFNEKQLAGWWSTEGGKLVATDKKLREFVYTETTLCI